MKNRETFPTITGMAVYTGYRPTANEIQALFTVETPVAVRVDQTSKWKYSAHFAYSRPRVPIRSETGKPIQGDISEVMSALAKRFERLIRPFVWYTARGESAPYEPTSRPAPKRTKKTHSPEGGKI